MQVFFHLNPTIISKLPVVLFLSKREIKIIITTEKIITIIKEPKRLQIIIAFNGPLIKLLSLIKLCTY